MALTKTLRTIGTAAALASIVGCGEKEICPEGGGGYFGPAQELGVVSVNSYNSNDGLGNLMITFQYPKGDRWYAVAGNLRMNAEELERLHNQINDELVRSDGWLGFNGNWVYNVGQDLGLTEVLIGPQRTSTQLCHYPSKNYRN